MKTLPIVRLYLCSLLLMFVFSACQPIQPQPKAEVTACNDSDKIALLQTIADGLNSQNAELAASTLLPTATFAFDAPPRPDPETGKYVSPGRLEATGREQYMNLLQAITSLQGGIHFENSQVDGDIVLATGGSTSSEMISFGTPTTDIYTEFKVTVQDCKIATYDAHYPESELDALSAKAEELDRLCSDEYKSKVFQRYINGINNGDPILASLPFAADALAEYDAAPVFDEASQSYVRGERNQWPSKAAIKQVFDYFISIQMTKSFDPAQFKITGQTLEAPVLVSTASFASDFDLPLTDLESFYIVEFGENCRITHLNHTFTDEALVKLENAKTAIACSDDNKIALFKDHVANTFDKGDIGAAMAFYAADGSLKVDTPPALDAGSGKYKVIGQYEGQGTSQLREMVGGSHATGVKMQINQVDVKDGLLIADVTGIGEWYVSMGVPTDTVQLVFTITFNDACKAQEFLAVYKDTFVQELKKSE